jgi:GntR family transcriptional regulator
VPNQHTVRQHLEELVSTGSSGERLPPERLLAEELGVARMTIRRAMDAMVAEGRIERRQGSGTYIRRPMVATRLQLASFTEEMRARGMEPSSVLVDLSDCVLSRDAARMLRTEPGERATRITRVRLGDGQPIALETVTIPQWCGLNLTRTDLAGSLYAALHAKYGIEVASAEAEIAVAVPTSAVAERLEMPADSACMRIAMVDADQFGRRIMAATCWYRPDRYRVHLGTHRANQIGHEARAS